MKPVPIHSALMAVAGKKWPNNTAITIASKTQKVRWESIRLNPFTGCMHTILNTW